MGAKLATPLESDKPTPPVVPEKTVTEDDVKRVQEGLKAENQRVMQLVKGEAKSPNEFVAYLVDKYKTAQQQYGQIQQEMTRMRAMVQDGDRRLAALEGQINAHGEDIKNWDKEI